MASSVAGISSCIPSMGFYGPSNFDVPQQTRHAACVLPCVEWAAWQGVGSTAATPSLTPRRCAPSPCAARARNPDSASSTRMCAPPARGVTLNCEPLSPYLRWGSASPCRIPNGWRLGAASGGFPRCAAVARARTWAPSAASRSQLRSPTARSTLAGHLHVRRGARRYRRPDDRHVGRGRHRHRCHRCLLCRPPRSRSRGERRARRCVRARARGHMCSRWRRQMPPLLPLCCLGHAPGSPTIYPRRLPRRRRPQRCRSAAAAPRCGWPWRVEAAPRALATAAARARRRSARRLPTAAASRRAWAACGGLLAGAAAARPPRARHVRASLGSIRHCIDLTYRLDLI